MAECLQWNRPHDSLCCMEICPPEKLTNVSHFISRGLFCNYQKDVAARRAATSMFWFKENQRPLIRLCAGKGLIGLEVRVDVVQNLADAHHLVVVGGRLAVDAGALRLAGLDVLPHLVHRI